jgi:hypothetical protein
MRFEPSEYSEIEIEFAFEAFVEGIKEKVAAHYANDFPTLTPNTIEVQPGRSYWKIVKVDGYNRGQSVFGFVRKADGAILKAATWKAPYTRGNNYVRGYVMEDDALNKTTPYGVVYAQ